MSNFLVLSEKNKLLKFIFTCVCFYFVFQIIAFILAYLFFKGLLIVSLTGIILRFLFFIITICVHSIVVGALSHGFIHKLSISLFMYFNIPVTIGCSLLLESFFVMWLRVFGNSNSKDIFIDIMLHFFKFDYTQLISFVTNVNGYVLLAFACICILSVLFTYKAYFKVRCKICGELKTEYFSCELLIPTSIFDNMKSNNKDFSLLENLEIGSELYDYGCIKINSCKKCQKSFITVYQYTQQLTSKGKQTLQNIICENIEVDYDWAQSLIAYYKEAEDKHNQKKIVI